MALKLFNYLSRKKETFKPLEGKSVGLYTCGPTVYDFAHIGNFRAYMTSDILKRHLKYSGYKIRHAMNITDVDDKTIKNSQKEKVPLKKFCEKYTGAFLGDLTTLNIEPADVFPKATEHIEEMVEIIKKLVKKGFAYPTDDGVYFKISKFKNYGKLSKVNLTGRKAGTRVSTDEYDKENIHDFALWKFWTPEDGEVFWETEIGKGRPGWHIECSAMSMKNIGEKLDIHTGGIDLVFPHHENEIAQSEATTGKKFVKYWIYNEHVLVDDKKMSKSLGNFYTLKDIQARNFNPLSYRYLVLNTHYRSRLNFTWEGLKSAKEALKNLQKAVSKQYINPLARSPKKERSFEKKFKEAMDDDLNTPQALSVVWSMIKNPEITHSSIVALALKFDKVLGLSLKTGPPIPPEVKEMALKREKFREEGNWAEADLIRSKMEKTGWSVEDTSQGPALRCE